MSDPMGFLLTFRTYGTWLHGDERGSVDREHNAPGAPMLPPNAPRLRYERESMCVDPMVLDDRMRGVVDAAILDQCKYRGWELIERAVRTNHVHIVVGYAGIRPEKMIQELKARATRWLREHGLVAADRRVWSDRPGSRRYLWNASQLNAAIEYVREGQDVPH